MPIAFHTLRTRAGVCIAVFAALLLAPSRASAQHEHQHHDDDHADHHDAPLHFSHPLFTESPSPDTKLRLDYIYANLARDLNDNTVRVEAEYAFSRNLSIEANLPMTSHSANDVRTTSVGSGEIALKLANFAAAEHGFLLGGGLAFGVPTGSDTKGIGSGHLVEIEPYVDLGYMHHDLEVVSFASYSTTTNRNEGEEKELEAALAVSLLYHMSRLESLIEMETRRALAGDESGHQVVNGGLGLKYHVPGGRPLVLGIGGRVPLTTRKEFRQEVIVSALYHF